MFDRLTIASPLNRVIPGAAPISDCLVVEPRFGANIARRRAVRSIIMSKSSREVGSIQCTSSLHRQHRLLPGPYFE
jgi:hypothetical protein